MLEVYPNPASDELYLDIRNAESKGGLAIEIYDICGRLALPRQNVEGYVSHLPIDISQLDNGIYNLQVVSEDQVIVKQFIVTKN